MTTETKPKRTNAREEASFQSTLMDWFALRGWRRQHSLRVRTAKGYRTPIAGDKGFMDLVVAKAGRMAFLELKKPKAPPSDLTDDELAWLNEAAGVEHDREWWMAKNEEPNHVTFGDEGGWDRLIAVVRPKHWPWIERTFVDMDDVLPMGAM